MPDIGQVTNVQPDGEGKISGLSIDEKCNIAVLRLAATSGEEIGLFCETLPTLDALHAAFGGVVERVSGHAAPGDLPEIRYCLANVIGKRIAYKLTKVGSLDKFAVLPDADREIIILKDPATEDAR